MDEYIVIQKPVSRSRSPRPRPDHRSGKEQKQDDAVVVPLLLTLPWTVMRLSAGDWQTLNKGIHP